jgi:chaperonin GroEL (HSP60 family)
MVINQLEKLFVTSDAATVIKELEVKNDCTNFQNSVLSVLYNLTKVLQLIKKCKLFHVAHIEYENQFQVQHPAAKMLILASQMQEQEVLKQIDFLLSPN